VSFKHSSSSSFLSNSNSTETWTEVRRSGADPPVFGFDSSLLTTQRALATPPSSATLSR